MSKNKDDFWAGKNILITGNTGFKGSWMTVLLLSQGANVWGYSLLPDHDNALYYSIINNKLLANSKWGELNQKIGDINNY